LNEFGEFDTVATAMMRGSGRIVWKQLSRHSAETNPVLLKARMEKACVRALYKVSTNHATQYLERIVN